MCGRVVEDTSRPAGGASTLPGVVVLTLVGPGAEVQLRLDADEVAAVEWCDAAGYRRWRDDGRRLSRVACELSEAFWAGRWASGPEAAG